MKQWFLGRDAPVRLQRCFASKRFFWIVVGLFVLQALWLVASARYPMAFDENFHFGLIQLHAQQWLPFFTQQPPNAEMYGAAVRDPSYLYHFLMSLPYRLLATLTDNQVVHIIGLRLLNVALLAWGLVLFRSLLLRLGASPALTHVSLFVFVMVPIVPFLGAHINYDNVFIVLTAGTLLVMAAWLESVRRRRISAHHTLGLLGLMMTATLVKYAFLPIAAIITAAGLLALWQAGYAQAKGAQLWRHLAASFRTGARWTGVCLVVLNVVVGGLFMERYAINIARYHAPNPDCAQILTVDQCRSYGPWGRDRWLAEHRPADAQPSLPYYVVQWLFGMWSRSFFAINYDYRTASPLPAPALTAVGLAVLSVLLGARYGWRLVRGNAFRGLCIAALLAYVAALFSQTYQSYVATNLAVAINGRYILPFLPVIIVFGGLALREALRGKPRATTIKIATAAATCCLFLWGGGALTFILRSDASWYWQSAVVQQANHTVRTITSPFTPQTQLDDDQMLDTSRF